MWANMLSHIQMHGIFKMGKYKIEKLLNKSDKWESLGLK
jgi:hypothetical protein